MDSPGPATLAMNLSCMNIPPEPNEISYEHYLSEGDQAVRCAPVTGGLAVNGLCDDADEGLRRCNGASSSPTAMTVDEPMETTSESEPDRYSHSSQSENALVDEPVEPEELLLAGEPFHGKVVCNPDGVICFLVEQSADCDVVPDVWPVFSTSSIYDSSFSAAASSSSSMVVPVGLFPFHTVCVVPSSRSAVQFFDCQLPTCPPSTDVHDRYRNLPLSYSPSQESPQPLYACLLCFPRCFESKEAFLQHGAERHEMAVPDKSLSSGSLGGVIQKEDAIFRAPFFSFFKRLLLENAPHNGIAQSEPMESTERSRPSPCEVNGISDSEDEEDHGLHIVNEDADVPNLQDRRGSDPLLEEHDSDSVHSCSDEFNLSHHHQHHGEEYSANGGRSSCVECPKCDIVLGSSKSLGGHMTMVHSRNSSKTLKCPKCNWHYKYQETLEIHMKEKHPEAEETCPYCLTGQTHPRLARGEVYSCGYKPYRCEICNYSTTSKGNLTIHMQSDKHVNNVQERHKNGGDAVVERGSPNEDPPAIPRSSSTSSVRATYRCDVCSYETNVSRNLRIHMTSEKHQQNYNLFIQTRMHENLSAASLHSAGGMGLLDPASMMQLMMSNAEMLNHPVNMAYLSSITAAAPRGPSHPGHHQQQQQRQPSDKLPENGKVFQCMICVRFMVDSYEELREHVSRDRGQSGEPNNGDSLQVRDGTSFCKYCQYKTNLKANFQLHCKTDKHVQKMQLVNHVREGGTDNEWRLQYLNTSNPVQVRCNACDYQTSSVHQMRVHCENNPHHELNVAALLKLRDLQLESINIVAEDLPTASSALIPPSSAPTRKWKLFCSLCMFLSKSQSTFMQHVRSHPHLTKWKQQRENDAVTSSSTDQSDLAHFISLKSYEDLTADQPKQKGPEAENGDGVHYDEEDDDEEEGFGKQEVLSSDDDDERENDESANLDHSLSDAEESASLEQHRLSVRQQQYICPLCQESFREKDFLETHLINKHNVHAEALERLMMLVETSGIWNSNHTGAGVAPHPHSRDASPSSSEADGTAKGVVGSTGVFSNDASDIYRCQKCSVTFHDIEQLYQHQNVSGHLELTQTARGPGYLCWKKGCNQYFKTANSLQTHFREIHARKSDSSSGTNDKHHDSDDGSGMMDENSQTAGEMEVDDEMNSQALAESGYRDLNRKYKCHRCKVAFTKQVYLTAHNKTLQHRRGEKNSYPMEKYLDPHRPHKCEVCKESFTQKNILLVHFNSVSHLHKLKRFRQEHRFGDHPGFISRESPEPAASASVAAPVMVTGNSAKKPANLEDENKPYRCGVCNVAYANSSNLDIHRRSVAHQSKVARLRDQTAVPNGAMDLSKPNNDESKSKVSQNVSVKLETPKTPDHDEQPKVIAVPSDEPAKPSASSSQQDSSAVGPGRPRVFGKSRSNMGWVSMLENIGIEVVQQYLENSQKPAKKPRDTTMEPVEGENLIPPELADNECIVCRKSFSTPWILKVHRESTHLDIIPLKILETVAAEYRKSRSDKPKQKRQTDEASPSTSKPAQSPVETPKKNVPASSSPVPAGNNYADILAAQMQLLPLLYPGLSMGSLSSMMNMNLQAAMMNLQPPLIGPNGNFSLAGLEAMGMGDLAKAAAGNQQSQNQKIMDLQSGQKRNRTRITDEQLQILRGHFDIRNPPSDDLLQRLCEQTGLELKVVKHWYRNTLFKERQRNKDSPYNFSVPPNANATPMDTDAPEKNGEVKVKTEPSPPHGLLMDVKPTELVKEPDFEVTTEKVVVKREESVDSGDSHPSPRDSSLHMPMTPSPTPTASINGSTREDRHGGKRANRTRFTDFQVKALQDYFDKNAYPKDDDLEDLSRALGLSPRVITVWFQNARQKARKSYENQTPPEEEVPIIRTPSLNYQCKKCLQVFQRYYELIRHQRAQCSGTSAGLNGSKDMDDTCSVASMNSGSSSKMAATVKSELLNSQQKLWDPSVSGVSAAMLAAGASPFMFPGLYPPNSPFGVLQMEAITGTSHALSRASSPSPAKRRASSDDEEEGSPNNKRVRTTIQPEQLDYLYQQYKLDSNPSRKQLDMIANKIGLKKRVVQVWYQNTRARERKGQLHLHEMSISKRCPVCRLLFKVRSALESHISVKHADVYCKGDVNIEDLPDTDAESADEHSPATSPVPQKQKPSPQPSVPTIPMMTESVKRFYEEAMKSYLNPTVSGEVIPIPVPVPGPAASTSKLIQSDAPLDLSAPYHPKMSAAGSSSSYNQHLDGSESCDQEGSEISSHERSMSSNAHHSHHSKPGKRFRTQMSNAQLKVMKRLFGDYKTPTMGECDLIGREIGLQKRVVQVWFQNARAKEKKNRLAGIEPDKTPVNEHCSLCKVSYTAKLTVQDHLFTKGHIELLKASEDCHEGAPPSAGMLARLAQQPVQREREARPSLPVPNMMVKKPVEMSERKPVEAAGPRKGPPATVKTEASSSHQAGMQMNSFGDINAMMMQDPLMAYMYAASMNPMYYNPAAMGGMLSPYGGLGAFYDPSVHGHPVNLLQLPPGAAELIFSKLSTQDRSPSGQSVAFAQDGKRLSDLRDCISPTDFTCATSTQSDIGSVCRKCQMVFPTEMNCRAHQTSMCYPGTKDVKNVLKLMQIHFRCSACQKQYATVDEFKNHCNSSLHQKHRPAQSSSVKRTPSSSSLEDSSGKRARHN